MNADKTPDLVIVHLERAWVDVRDVGPALASLRPFCADLEAVCRCAGRVMLVFDGYDSDKRELWDIPEVRAWFKQLTLCFPYWFVFCDRDSPALALVLNLLLDMQGAAVMRGGEVIRHYSPGQIAALMRYLFAGMNQLGAEVGASEALIDTWTAGALRSVDRVTGGDS